MESKKEDQISYRVEIKIFSIADTALDVVKINGYIEFDIFYLVSSPTKVNKTMNY